MTASATLLVIPCYRHGTALTRFLPELCAALTTCPGRVTVLVTDDGSPADEQRTLAAAIEQLRPRYPALQPLLAAPANHGKGHAIRAGWDTAVSEPWLAFVDADGAVPASEVATLLTAALQSPAPAVFAAVRATHAGKSVQRHWHRHLGSRLFNAWVRHHLRFNLSDTQCGLKVVPAALHRTAPWNEAGFAFDLELLLRARTTGLPIHAHPIAWREQPGSTLGWRDTLALFTAARRLRATLK